MPASDPLGVPVRTIVRAFAGDLEHGPHRGQAALAALLGYSGRESVALWFAGLDSGDTSRRTTPPQDARRRLWAVMDARAPGMLDAAAALGSTALRREIAETRTWIAAGAYPDAGAPYAAPRQGTPAARLAEAA